MSEQNITSELLAELSTDEQQLLSGGQWRSGWPGGGGGWPGGGWPGGGGGWPGGGGGWPGGGGGWPPRRCRWVCW